MSKLFKVAPEVMIIMLSLYVFALSPVSITDHVSDSPSVRVVPVHSDFKFDERCVVFSLMRHGETTMNTAGKIQGNSQEGNIVLTPEFLSICGFYSQAPIFDTLYSGDNGRTSLTMQCLSGRINSEACTRNPAFNEQALGIFEGQSSKEVLHSMEFKKMLSSLDYKVAEDAATGKYSETGREVITRMLGGFHEVAHKHVGQKVGVCSSQCAMNWFYRWVSQDYQAVLRLANLDAIVFKYYVDPGGIEDKIQLLTDKNVPFRDAYKLIAGIELLPDSELKRLP